MTRHHNKVQQRLADLRAAAPKTRLAIRQFKDECIKVDGVDAPFDMSKVQNLKECLTEMQSRISLILHNLDAMEKEHGQ